MNIAKCPKCKEEIKDDAIICKHCHEKLSWSREEVVMAAITERIQFVANTVFTIPEVTACGALCYAHFAKDKVKLDACLEDCKAASAIAAVAERLQRLLILTFADIVWGGGDIDPIPFERLVRERFSRPDEP